MYEKLFSDVFIPNNPPAVIGVGGLHQLLRAAPPPALFPRSLPGKQPTGPPGGLAGPPGWPGRLAGQPGPARLGQPARPAGRAGRARLGPLWSPKWERWTPNHEFVMQFWSRSVGHI